MSKEDIDKILALNYYLLVCKKEKKKFRECVKDYLNMKIKKILNHIKD